LDWKGLDWIGHVNRMSNKRKVSQVFDDNTQGSRLKGRPKTNGGIVCKRTLIDAKLEERSKSRADWEKSINLLEPSG
jgi:hypothetical protein